MTILRICYLFLLLLTAQAQGQELVLDDAFSSANLQKHSEFLRTDSQWQLSEIQSMPDWHRDINTQPLEPKQALWVRTNLHHQSLTEQEFVISQQNLALDKVSIFLLDDMGRILKSWQKGAEFTSPHRQLQLPFSLAPNQSLFLYIKIQDDGPMVTDLRLWQGQAFAQHEQGVLVFIGIIAGALGVLSCYFLLTYIILRAPVRYWFALASFSFALLYLNLQGIVGLYTGLQHFQGEITTLITALVVFTSAKFSFNLIGTVPAYWRAVAYLLASMVATSTFAFDAYWQLIISLSLAGGALLLQVLLALAYHQGGHTRVTRLYALGWLIVGTSAFIQASLYLLKGNLDIELLFTFTIVAGILLLTVAVEFHQQLQLKQEYQKQASTSP